MVCVFVAVCGSAEVCGVVRVCMSYECSFVRVRYCALSSAPVQRCTGAPLSFVG